MRQKFKSSLLLGTFLSTIVVSYAQSPIGWHTKSWDTDGYYGINLSKAYTFLQAKKLKSNAVIVGIIDTGIDTTHQDLHPVLWTNTKEITGNGLDDDANGYIDDIHGWNFIGSRDGKQDVIAEGRESDRVYINLKAKYEGKTLSDISKDDSLQYITWKRAEKEYTDASESVNSRIIRHDLLLRKRLGSAEYTLAMLNNFETKTDEENKAKLLLLIFFNWTSLKTNTEILEIISKIPQPLSESQSSSISKNYRNEIVKDNPDDISDRNYGNTNLGSYAEHGTHVAGIIGAKRTNGIGIDGIADNVKIMSIRAVPDGDEHDKDIALAIRYAVENGAKIINMSFGKAYSPQKKWVDDAVRYAESKNVLLIHAAGNESKDIDIHEIYPSAYYLDQTKADNFINVGATGSGKGAPLIAAFSNYGLKNVDLFAPGVGIYSTVPTYDRYGSNSGTSMAAPVVSGVAALLCSYFPHLTAAQIKYVLLKSAAKPSIRTKLRNVSDKEYLLSELSLTGGIVDAYEAVKLASTIKIKRNKK